MAAARLLLALAAPLVAALDNGLGRTPPMGYSSWNDCASEITEQRIKNVTLALAETGLAAKGYVHVNVDEGWLLGRDNATGELVQSDGSIGFPVAGSAYSPALDERARSFGFFRQHPPGQSSLSGSIVGSTAYSVYSVSRSYTMARPQATEVSAVLRTSEVYVDRNEVLVTYQLRDALGNTYVDSSASVSVEVVHEDGVLTFSSSSCSTLFDAGGIGECAATLSGEWFASSSSAGVPPAQFDQWKRSTQLASGVRLWCSGASWPFVCWCECLADAPRPFVC